MQESRQLIAAFKNLNETPDRNIGHFSPGLVGMFGSTAMLNHFLSELDSALAKGAISAPLKERSRNLSRTFIPQIASLNGISGLSGESVPAARLENIKANDPGSRSEGVKVILTALRQVLNEAIAIN